MVLLEQQEPLWAAGRAETHDDPPIRDTVSTKRVIAWLIREQDGVTLADPVVRGPEGDVSILEISEELHWVYALGETAEEALGRWEARA